MMADLLMADLPAGAPWRERCGRGAVNALALVGAAAIVLPLALTFYLRAQPEITAMIDMKNNYALPKL